jgi:hypothetical protein
LMPREGLVRTTVAPGMTAPVASVTIPVMEALSWALRAKGADRRIASMAILATRVLISIFSYGKKGQQNKGLPTLDARDIVVNINLV